MFYWLDDTMSKLTFLLFSTGLCWPVAAISAAPTQAVTGAAGQQHHEHADGTGFPQRINMDRMSTGARIVALFTQEGAYGHGAKPGRATTAHVNHALRALAHEVQKEGWTSLALPRLATGVGSDGRTAAVVTANNLLVALADAVSAFFRNRLI